MDAFPPLRFAWRQLTDPGRTMLGYIGRAWLVQISIILLLIPLAFLIGSGAGDEREMPIPDLPVFELWLGLAIFIPLIETAFHATAIEAARQFTRNRVVVGLIIGLIAAIIHGGVNTLPNGLINAWSFFAMTVAYQVASQWGWWRGPLVAFAMHALTNTLSVLLVSMGS